jgi:hypothetical protein
MDQLSERLRAYLDLTAEEYFEDGSRSIGTLMELKADSAKEAATDLDAKVDTTGWRYYCGRINGAIMAKPVYIWQPISAVPKYNIVPLIVGSKDNNGCAAF